MAERRIINGYIVERQPDGRLVTIGPAGGTAPQMPANPTFPYEGPKAQADLTKTVTDNEIAIATKDDAIRKAKADADKAEADALKAKRDAETATTPAELQKARAAQVQAAKGLHNQLDRVEDLYDKNFRNNGLGAVLEFNPWSAANRQFDAAANVLMPFVKPLARTPGEGATDKSEYQDYRDLLPSGTSFDSTNDERILGLREMANSILRENGLPEYTRPKPEEKRNENPFAAAGNAPSTGGGGPQGPDKSTRWLGEPPQGGGSGFVPYGQEYRRVDNPALKGVNERLNNMIRSGASREQILGYAQSAGVDTSKLQNLDAVLQFRAANPNYKGGYNVNVDDMYEPMSAFEQFRNNAPQTAVGAGLTAAANAASFGIPQALAPEQMQYIRDQSPVASFVGDVAGIVGATSGIGAAGNSLARSLAPRALTGGGRLGNMARAAAPDAVYGAAYGGITEGDPLTGAATATLGSGAGQVIGKGGQKLFQGVTDPGVQYLSARGIPMTPGQILGNESRAGRFVQGIESMPYIGPAFSQRKVEGLQAFNREAMNDAVAPVGGRVTTFGPDGLQQAQDAVSQGYRNALDGVNITPDAQFAADAQAARQAGAAVPKFGEDFTYMMGQEVDPVLNGGVLTGPQLQSALQSIGNVRSNFAQNGDAMARYAADAAGQMDNAVTGLVSRQAPDVMPAYNEAKQAFQSLVPIENAAISAVNSGAGQGVFTPRQLARSITTNTKNYGGRAAAARGDNLTDLIRYSQAVLPDTVPNSGTADRIASLLVPTALGGTAAGVSLLSPEWAVPIATLAALTSKPGQALTQAALVKRPAAIRRAGGIFGGRKAQKGLAGMVTAPLLIED